MNLTPEQLGFLSAPTKHRYLHGRPGSGKTTAAREYLTRLYAATPADDGILILTPHRHAALPYRQHLQALNQHGPDRFTLTTFAGIAQQMLDLFWPAIVKSQYFPRAKVKPVFLNADNAMFLMDEIVAPRLEQGDFHGLTIDYSLMLLQLLDNINKSAMVGFPLEDIFPRLSRSVTNADKLAGIHAAAQACADEFRRRCIENTWLDYSLQIEVFTQVLQDDDLFKAYFASTYRHLIVDNLEEETPVMHDTLTRWLPWFETTLLINDDFSGYRYFLGGDPHSAERFSAHGQDFYFETSVTTPSELLHFEKHLVDAIVNKKSRLGMTEALAGFSLLESSTQIEQFDQIAEYCRQILSVEPLAVISMVSPYVSSILTASAAGPFERHGLHLQVTRPSSNLMDEPVIRAMSTVLSLTNPEWGLPVNSRQVTSALMSLIPEMDLFRAGLIADTAMKRLGEAQISKVDTLAQESQSRIGEPLGLLADTLIDAVNAVRGAELPLDAVLMTLFDETLSSQGFLFRERPATAGLVKRLLEAYQQHLRAYQTGESNRRELDKRFVRFLSTSAISAYYAAEDEDVLPHPVSLMPLTSYLLSNQIADYQFWLDIGNASWWERIYQPLTHPYILSRNWQLDSVWKDSDEYAANQDKMARLTSGLIRRCRSKLFLCSVAYNDRGEQQKGPLLKAVGRVLRRQASDAV